MSKQEKFFIHSRCCNAHWELVVYDDKTSDLLCEVCGQSIGKKVKVEVLVEAPKCEVCELV